jgi:dual specificity phosphatase 12
MILGLVLLSIVFSIVLLGMYRKRKHKRVQNARELFDELKAETRGGNMNGPNEIFSGLFIGSIVDSSSAKLQKHKITAVLGLAKMCVEQQNTDITRLFLPSEDKPFFDISQYFDRAFDFIDRELSSGGRVLVYCHEGGSRSATIVAMYLQRKLHWSTRDAVFHLKRIRPSIVPNEGFLEQLLRDNETL